MKPVPSDADIARVKETWGSGDGATKWRTPQWLHWTQHPKVQERLNFLVTGDARINRFEYFMDRYLRGRMPVARSLTLGSGHGELERGLAQYNFALSHEGVDIAEGAVAEATRLASEAGLKNISYRVADLNLLELPKMTYDVVFGVGSIHHTSRLEYLFAQVAASLKPDGYFFLDEFVGPSQFQWSRKQLSLVNKEVRKLPADYRKCVNNPGQPKPQIKRVGIAAMNAIDPSEAVRSADIAGLLPKYFDVVETRGAGGSLLHLLLEHIAGNFDESDPVASRYLESLFNLEDQYIASGALHHDFAVIIASKRE